MTRVLYIGDPSSVHDLKWISWFSNNAQYQCYMLCQENEFKQLTNSQREILKSLKIKLEAPIKSYSLWRFWENASSSKIINEVIERERIDLVHVLFATPFALWTRNLPVPSIITCRGSDIHVVLAGLGKGSFMHKIHGKLLLRKFQEALEKAVTITCTSQGQLDRINSVFRTNLKAEIIRTGVNVEEIDQLEPKPKLPSIFSGKKIIFLPRYIRPIYQTELQLKAISALPEELKSSIGLVLIKGNRTDDSYVNEIQQLLDASGVAYHVFDSLSQHQMWSVFKLSTLAIMTPKTDGTPNSALEAMAAKCPLILGSFNYDEDLFSEQFCNRMKTDSVSELSDFIADSLQNYPQEKIEAAFVNVSKLGNRPMEMERLKEIYLSFAKR